MATYKRILVPGGTTFFTVRLQDRQSRLLTDHIDTLRDCVRLARARWPFAIEAAVVLPDHLHMIWTLPPGDADYSKRWRLIKSAFSRQMAPVAAPASPLTPSQIARGEKGIWQRRFWEHQIRDAADMAAHRAYVLGAPVHAGLAARPTDWRWSSVHRDVQRGVPVPATGGYGALAWAQGGLKPTLPA